jgi:hypothetical protein
MSIHYFDDPPQSEAVKPRAAKRLYNVGAQVIFVAYTPSLYRLSRDMIYTKVA